MSDDLKRPSVEKKMRKAEMSCELIEESVIDQIGPAMWA